MQSEIFTKKFIKCPNEKCLNDFNIDHCDNGFKSIWTCDKCHNTFSIGFENDICTTEIYDIVEQSTVVVKYTSSKPLYLVTQLNAGTNHKFYIEEHTCPINVVSGAMDVIVGYDIDCHGAFEVFYEENQKYDRDYDRDHFMRRFKSFALSNE